jgi:uncharacterized membrane-anchored protein
MQIQEKVKSERPVVAEGVIIYKKPPIWKLLVVILPQFFLFSLIIGKQEFSRAYGKAVYLQLVQPRDPRDLFMGEHVVLHYQIARSEVVQSLCGANIPLNATLFLSLKEDTTKKVWKADGCTFSMDRLKGDTLYIKGTYTGGWNDAVTFGIEKYFVPEGKGLWLEDLLRKKMRAGETVKARVIIGLDGKAFLDSLWIENSKVELK